MEPVFYIYKYSAYAYTVPYKLVHLSRELISAHR